MHGIGRVLISLGALLLVAGIVVLLAEKLSLPVGRLPGDISWRGKNSAVYFPFTTCILLSALLTFILYIVSRMRR